MTITKKATITIRKGTKVLSEHNSIVTLQGDVTVDAMLQADGIWLYTIGSGKNATAYQASDDFVEVEA